MSKLKTPPSFNPDEDSYEAYKKDLQIWNTFTDLEEKKKGPAVYLSLAKNTREAVRNLSIEELNADDGLNKIIAKLDDVYLADSNTRAYAAFQKFYNCKRESGETFVTFIIRFEQLYNDLVSYGMSLPEGIRAFFVLNASNLQDDMEKLARATTTDLTYKDMKAQIKKICGTSSASSNEDTVAPPLKDEVLFSSYNKKGFRGRGGYRGKSRGFQERKRSEGRDVAGNPVNQHGVKLRCYVCKCM